MTSNYTCHRCLYALSKAARPNTRSLVRKSSSYARRGQTSSSTTRSPRPQHDHSQPQSKILNPFSKRSAHAAATPGPKFEWESGEYKNIIYPPSLPYPETYGRILIEPDDLFHPLSKSPIPDMRQRAAYIRQHAYCPHPDHQQTRMPVSPNDPETRKVARGAPLPPMHVKYECPDCGTPTYCSEDHWADDYEAHLEICDLLRQINEDDHDLRSGRHFPEFEYPGPLYTEFQFNLTNWDTFLYTRQFEALNDDSSMRQGPA